MSKWCNQCLYRYYVILNYMVAWLNHCLLFIFKIHNISYAVILGQVSWTETIVHISRVKRFNCLSTTVKTWNILTMDPALNRQPSARCSALPLERNVSLSEHHHSDNTEIAIFLQNITWLQICAQLSSFTSLRCILRSMAVQGNSSISAIIPPRMR